MRRESQRLRKALIPLLLALVALLSACAPVTGPRPGAAADELQRTAQLAYHRMEIGYLQTGSYTTNALVDLQLPRGVRWTLEEFSEQNYRLRFTDDSRPGVAWLVSPAGVTAASESVF